MAHLDPVEHAAQHYGAMHARQEAQEQAEAAAVVAFIKSCQKLDANGTAWFAPMVNDFSKVRSPLPVGTPIPKRTQTLAEVMVDSLDYVGGPSMTQAMQLLLNVAFGADCQANLARQARELLAEMANAHASNNVVVEV